MTDLPADGTAAAVEAARLDRLDRIADLVDALWHLAHGAINRVHLSPLRIHVLARDLLCCRAWSAADQPTFDLLRDELERLLQRPPSPGPP